MSLPKNRDQGSFFDASYLLEGLFNETDRFRVFQNKILPALLAIRPQLDELYCQDDGRPALDPIIMAGVTVLQFMEKAPDRKAIEMVRLHLGWKFALDLPVDFSGFHATSLVSFRTRLVEADQARIVFDGIVEALRKEGFIKKRCKQRLDSTHILGCVSLMGRLEKVRETLRLAVQEIGRIGISNPVANWEILIERYIEGEIDWHSQNDDQLKNKMLQAGKDCLALLNSIQDQKDKSLLENDQVKLLQRVFEEQFEVQEDEVKQRIKEDSGVVQNPHDPDAQWSAKGKGKKKKSWVGYKAQVLETLPEDSTPKKKGEPTDKFLTDLATTEAITSDLEGMERTLSAQQKQGQEDPSELFVDTAYVTDDTLAEAEEQQRQLVGPARRSPNNTKGFDSDKFDVDTDSRKAICPAGKVSTQCSLINDQHHGNRYYRFEWSSHCDSCPLQKNCTTSKSGRRTLIVGIYHNLLQKRRKEMKEESFKERMKQRNGIEGTISELARFGMRRSRYRGMKKTSLANYFLGAACNIHRWIRLEIWQAEGQLG